MKLFKIQPIDSTEARRVIGDSVPAVATATAVAAGLACINFLKLFRYRDQLSRSRSLSFQDQEQIRAIFCQSSVSLETLQPAVYHARAASQMQLGGLRWTVWDSWRLPQLSRIQCLWRFLKEQGVDFRMLADVSSWSCCDWVHC